MYISLEGGKPQDMGEIIDETIWHLLKLAILCVCDLVFWVKETGILTWGNVFHGLGMDEKKLETK